MDNQPNSTPNNTNAAELREKLQNDVVSIITKKLESGEMTEERAKAIAKLTLEKLPENITYKQLMEVVPTLDDEFQELQSAILPIVKDYQQKVYTEVNVQISDLLKQKKFEDALKLARKAVDFESKLV